MSTDYDYERADALAEARADMPRKARTGCVCFGPGEVGGTCPGRDRCPIADEHDDDEGDDE
jgi:hypothetical protein